MTTRESIEQILQDLPNDRLRQVLDFTRFLSWQEEREAWQRFGQTQFARAYGEDEPDYTETDIKRDDDR